MPPKQGLGLLCYLFYLMASSGLDIFWASSATQAPKICHSSSCQKHQIFLLALPAMCEWYEWKCPMLLCVSNYLIIRTFIIFVPGSWGFGSFSGTFFTIRGHSF